MSFYFISIRVNEKGLIELKKSFRLLLLFYFTLRSAEIFQHFFVYFFQFKQQQKRRRKELYSENCKDRNHGKYVTNKYVGRTDEIILSFVICSRAILQPPTMNSKLLPLVLRFFVVFEEFFFSVDFS